MIELYKFTTVEDGITHEYRWTSGPHAVSWDGHTWEPKIIDRTSIKIGLKVTGGGITVTIGKDQDEEANPVVSAFHQNRIADPIALAIYEGDPADLAGTVEPLWMGEVAKVRRGTPAKVLCEPVVTIGRQELPVGRFSRSCRWQLYSRPCGVDEDSADVRELFTVTELQPEIKAFKATTTADLATAWANGGIYWEFNSGVEVFVKSSELLSDNGDGTYTHLVRLKQWPERTINVGLEVYLKAGCNHTMEDCKTKFDNLYNFGGFPITPDDVYRPRRPAAAAED